MSSDYTDKDTFMARWGDGDHLEKVIKTGIEPLIRVSMKNRHFDAEHHEQMKNDSRGYVRELAVHSPHVTKEDLSGWLRDRKSAPQLIGNALQHRDAHIEDMKHVAFNYPNKNVVGAAINAVHSRNGWKPEDMPVLANRKFPSAPSPHLSIPVHIWNSVMTKDHPPLTQADVNNAFARERGGTLK